MLVQQMHIGIDLGLQKINSQVNKNITPEEKDWFLNDEVDKFIKQRKSPNSNIKQTGFQDTTKRLEDLKDLIRTESADVLRNIGGENYAVLPSNYYDYIRVEGKVAKRCEINPTSTSIDKYKTTFKLNLPLDEALTTYTITALVGGTTKTLFDLSDLPNGYINSEVFKKQQFLLIKALMIKLEGKVKTEIGSTSSLYWEQYGYDYNALSFTLITDVPLTDITVTVNTTPEVFTPDVFPVNTYNLKDLPLKSKIRVVDEEFSLDVENSALSKSRENSLTSVLREGVTVVHVPKSVILGKVVFVYICQPTLIDLHLNSSLNMSDKICKEIVDNTVRFIKGLIEDNNYQNYVRENVLIE